MVEVKHGDPGAASSFRALCALLLVDFKFRIEIGQSGLK